MIYNVGSGSILFQLSNKLIQYVLLLEFLVSLSDNYGKVMSTVSVSK